MQQCPRCKGVGSIYSLEDSRPIGEKLRGLRMAQGATLRKTAEKMGKSATYLSRLERGEEVWTATLETSFLNAIGHSTECKGE